MAYPYYLVIFLSVLHLESHTVSVCDGLPTLQKGDAMTPTKIMWPIGMSHNKFTNLWSKYQSRGTAIHFFVSNNMWIKDQRQLGMFLCNFRNIHTIKSFPMKKFDRSDDSKLHQCIGCWWLLTATKNKQAIKPKS